MAQAQHAVGRLKEILDIRTGGDYKKQMGCQTDPSTTKSKTFCRWAFNPDWDESRSADLANWDRRRPAEVERLLRELSQMTLGDLINPKIRREKLNPLAQLGLCYHHKRYENDLVAKWVHNIESELQQTRRAQAERELQAQAERERLAQAERERQAQAEREQLAQAERERQAQAERERQAQAERERQAQAECERQAQAERARQARERQKRRETEERARRAQEAQQHQATKERERRTIEERERLVIEQRERQAKEKKRQAVEEEQGLTREKSRQIQDEQQRHVQQLPPVPPKQPQPIVTRVQDAGEAEPKSKWWCCW
jgi:hypothetical protein